MMKTSATLVSRCVKRSGHTLRCPPLSTSALPHDDHDNHRHELEKMMSEGGGSTTSFHEKKDEVKSKIGVGDTNEPSENSAKNKLHETKDAASEKADAAGSKMKEKLHEAKDTVSENANAASSAAKDKVHDAKEMMSDTADSASEKGKHMLRDASHVTGEKAGQAQSFMGKVGEQAKKEMNTSADMMKDIPQKVAETTQGLKEVGVEAAKALQRDASRVAEKVGLKDPS